MIWCAGGKSQAGMRDLRHLADIDSGSWEQRSPVGSGVRFLTMANMKRWFGIGALVAALPVAFAIGWLVAKTGIGSAMDLESMPELERQFVQRMRAVSLVGRFTIAGREDEPARPDRYDIASVEKVGDDRWRFNVRIRYGERDVTLPVAVTMRWTDDTPMVMLTDTTIPTLGTFTARVFFYEDRYAGTWQHGETGGHMFGNIVPTADAAP